jgi:hypothetical protein
VSYKFSNIDIRQDKSSYQYSTYFGLEFFIEWKKTRAAILRSSNVAKVPPFPIIKSTKFDNLPINTQDLLEYIYSESIKPRMNATASFWAEKLLKKFEVTHRIHENYNENFRASDVSKHKCLSLYVRFAEVSVEIFRHKSDIRYLNILLKLLDILTFEKQNLCDDLLKRTARLVAQELEFLTSVALTHKIQL